MSISFLYSIKPIEQQYRTGEEPVLVMCSDMNAYVCKYMRSSSAAFKLACEFIGSRMAIAWQIETPETALVHIKQEHWAGKFIQHSLSAPALGSKKLDGIIDITPSTYDKVAQTATILRQLLKIALFDFWIANEDRNANNANLLYDVVRNRLISIDYGCILNTATFDYQISQLTSTDTILWSDLFQHLTKGKSRQIIESIANDLKDTYYACIKRSERQRDKIIAEFPVEWNIPSSYINEKLEQLFEEQWITETWNNYIDCLNENLEDE